MANAKYLEPIETYVLAGIQDRFTKVFNCPAFISEGIDRMKAVEKAFGGKPPTYPYAFLNVTSLSHNKESFNSRLLAHNGVLMNAGTENTQYRLKIMPTLFNIDGTFTTNKYVGNGSSMWFGKRWLFAYRAKHLNFNIEYGSHNFRINTELVDSLSIPSRENQIESESVYNINFSLIVQGYVSESKSEEVGIVNSVEMDSVFRPLSAWSFRSNKTETD